MQLPSKKNKKKHKKKTQKKNTKKKVGRRIMWDMGVETPSTQKIACSKPTTV